MNLLSAFSFGYLIVSGISGADGKEEWSHFNQHSE